MMSDVPPVQQARRPIPELLPVPISVNETDDGSLPGRSMDEVRDCFARANGRHGQPYDIEDEGDSVTLIPRVPFRASQAYDCIRELLLILGVVQQQRDLPTNAVLEKVLLIRDLYHFFDWHIWEMRNRMHEAMNEYVWEYVSRDNVMLVGKWDQELIDCVNEIGMAGTNFGGCAHLVDLPFMCQELSRLDRHIRRVSRGS